MRRALAFTLLAALGSGAGGIAATALPTARDVPPDGRLVGHPTTSGASYTFSYRCTGKPGQVCYAHATVSAVLHYNSSGVLTNVTARGKAHTQKLVLGTTVVSAHAGHTAAGTAKLSHGGQALLKRRGALSATFRIQNAAGTAPRVTSATLTFTSS